MHVHVCVYACPRVCVCVCVCVCACVFACLSSSGLSYVLHFALRHVAVASIAGAHHWHGHPAQARRPSRAHSWEGSVDGSPDVVGSCLITTEI